MRFRRVLGTDATELIIVKGMYVPGYGEEIEPSNFKYLAARVPAPNEPYFYMTSLGMDSCLVTSTSGSSIRVKCLRVKPMGQDSGSSLWVKPPGSSASQT
jgi:hypothetical protein